MLRVASLQDRSQEPEVRIQNKIVLSIEYIVYRIAYIVYRKEGGIQEPGVRIQYPE